MPDKEQIIKTRDFQIRHRGRVVVSLEKEWAIDYILNLVQGCLDSSGTPLPSLLPSLLVFVDDSASHISSVIKHFTNQTIIPVTTAVVFYEPTVDQVKENPKCGDNPLPESLEFVYSRQKEWSLKLEPNLELLRFTQQLFNQ